MKRSVEERLRIVKSVRSGISISSLSREYKLHECRILEWVRRYAKYGLDGIKNQPRSKVSGEFKEKLVRLHEEKGVPLSHIVVQYRISRTSLEKWVRSAREKGYIALYKPKPIDPAKGHMARPGKKEPQTELEKLQAENLRLRAENALLKKVKALVEEQEARSRHSGRKPSTN